MIKILPLTALLGATPAPAFTDNTEYAEYYYSALTACRVSYVEHNYVAYEVIKKRFGKDYFTIDASSPYLTDSSIVELSCKAPIVDYTASRQRGKIIGKLNNVKMELILQSSASLSSFSPYVCTTSLTSTSQIKQFAKARTMYSILKPTVRMEYIPNRTSTGWANKSHPGMTSGTVEYYSEFSRTYNGSQYDAVEVLCRFKKSDLGNNDINVRGLKILATQ
ncbi:hypothetical protein CWB96_22455 [Pseudoalteromonas citrea]|uniref:Uncharacterized protein n=1 Tax=Pseudoalteromonas citrea TaxID=43655 RepID=A0A5S3XDT2_9GAMM|nr:hypothetical protein [Pseudoalteromonas citrea]TMP37835.1 hypothetical protein CWB97_22540 [Pseudoalteromonas citrea]TMP51212.1 hypothetical protein CWB96_22455 [Pseudoalteromonas citrea]